MLNSTETWQIHSFPYQTLPPLDCHIAPPFAVINAGPKCARVDLAAMAQACCETDAAQKALEDRLDLLCDTWNLFEGAGEDARDWEKQWRGKRKREREDEDIARLAQFSERTTRSKDRSTGGSAGQTQEVRFAQNIQQGEASGSHKRNWTHTLSEHAVSLLEKQQKVDLNSMVKCWVESACC